MSKNSTSSKSTILTQHQFENLDKHTVFYLVHKKMKTMPTIDEPIRFNKPIALKNSLQEIQQNHQKILKYIKDFDAKMHAQRRLVAANLPRIQRERARKKEEQERRARRRAEAEERVAQKRKPLHAKRRSIPPKRINSDSFSGQSYKLVFERFVDSDESDN